MRALAAGAIALGPGRRMLDCVVRDVSEGGALLLMEAPLRAPAELILAVGGALHPARVVWRGGGAVGVAFAPAVAPCPARPGAVVSLDAARRRRAPDADSRRLAERIARFVRPRGCPVPT